MRGRLGGHRGIVTVVRAPAAALVVAFGLCGPLRAQVPAAPGAGNVGVRSGEIEYTVARLVGGRLEAAGPCVAADGPLDAALEWRVTATGPHQVMLPRQIHVGSGEWNRVAARLLALADRRERDERRATKSTSGVPRFLDWVFVSDARGDPLYYFETSRRIPRHLLWPLSWRLKQVLSTGHRRWPPRSGARDTGTSKALDGVRQSFTSPPVDPDTADTDPPGTLRIAVSGFARIDAKGATPLGTKGELRWEEDGRPRGPIRPDLRPLGIVNTSGGDVVWVMEGRTPTASMVSLFSVGARGTALVSARRIGRC